MIIKSEYDVHPNKKANNIKSKKQVYLQNIEEKMRKIHNKSYSSFKKDNQH